MSPLTFIHQNCRFNGINRRIYLISFLDQLFPMTMAALLRLSSRLRSIHQPTNIRFITTAAGSATNSAATIKSEAINSSGRTIFQHEPAAPHVNDPLALGHKSKAYIKELDEVFDTRSMNMMVDYTKSIGNYVVDADGNEFLDVYAQIASIPVGYQNPRVLEAARSWAVSIALASRPALGNFPPHDWASTLKTGVLRVAPKGMNQVFTALAGSDANETAYKAAFMYRRLQERGSPEVDFTAEEMTSSMNNQSPGSPQLSILSFRSAFHGRLFGSLSTTRSKPIHKLDIPAFDWPQAPFPRLQYPLADHVQENAAEEARCLAETEDLIQNFHHPVAAVVVEPIQSEGGDNHASPAFFRSLREMTKRHKVLFIVDEVQTGVGATGKFWAHQHWNLSEPPDMVTFSKKAQMAGYYYGNPQLRPNKPYRQFNTWMGDPARAILFKAIIEEIENRGLVENTAEVGDYLHSELEKLAHQYPNEIQNLRGKGQGTFIAWDSPQRDEFLLKMKKLGILMGGSGQSAIRLRPMLIFEKHHGKSTNLKTV